MSEDIKQYGHMVDRNIKGSKFKIGDKVQYLSDGKNWDKWRPMKVIGIGEFDVDNFWYYVKGLPFVIPEHQLRLTC